MSGAEATTLVVGAAGPTAGHVLTALAAIGGAAVGLVRRPEQADIARAAGASEVVIGDLTDSSSMRAALEGIDRVFYIAPAFLPDEADVGVQFVRLATEAGVGRVVFSSVVHPVLSGLVNHAAKAPVEEAILDSGLDFVFLHPTLFFQNLAAGVRNAVRTGVFAEPWSVATRFSRVDYRDVAEVAARALLTDDLLDGTFELAAPGHLDRTDLAALISTASGISVRAERADASGSPPGLSAMFAHYDEHGLLANALTLKALLGRAPRRIEAYIAEVLADARGGVSA